MAFVALALSTRPVDAQQVLGQWSPIQPYDMHSIPIHMALTRGDGAPYHSRVVWWGYDAGAAGGVLGWRAEGADCTSFPDTLTTNPNHNLVPLWPWGTTTDLFCGGQTTLADGSLLSVGGTDPNYWGLDAAVTYPRIVAGSAPGSWAARAPMNDRRWYPTATLLRDRVLVAAGTKSDELWFYGGRRGGAQAPPAVLAGGHNIERTGRVDGGDWDPSLATVSTAGEMPIPREGHTFVTLTDLGKPVLFGGTDSAGTLILNAPNYVWTLDREVGGDQDQDYTYRWAKRTVQQGPVPIADRTEHTALAVSASEMLLFGGTSAAGQEFWRLYKDGAGAWKWAPVDLDPSSGSPPPARFGTTAVYDEHAYPAPYDTVRRMIVYGGSPTLGGNPSDNKVYIFTFSGSGFSSGTWSFKDLPNGPLNGLYNHAMVISPHPWNPPGRRIAWIYGGCSAGCTGSTPTTSNVLWRLRLDSENPDNIVWESASPAPAGPNPGARVGHAMFYDSQSRRISVVGGSATDRHMFQIDRDLIGDADWIQAAEAPVGLTGHAVCFDPSLYKPVARIPEIYDPADSSWTPQPLAARSTQYYPQQFLTPRTPFRADSCRVVVVGPDSTRYLDIPNAGQAPRWNAFTNPHPGFTPFTAVMYQPGKVLAAGGLVPHPWPTPPTVVSNAAKLDAAAIPNGVGWQQTNTMSYDRVFHNLVLLPNGRVLAVGGMTGYQSDGNWDPANARSTPEWWDPGSGAWSSLSPHSGVIRNYHSTAVLLPDGRVLAGGGWWYDPVTKTNPNPNMKRLQVFCPPYLFNSSGNLAQRPVIVSAPDTVSWRQTFSVCVSDPATVTSACLIRPGATTHGFDMSQRFVPLVISARTGTGAAADPKRLYLTAPASPDSAPAGDYMLFVVGSAERTDVSSIAKWVYVRGDGVDWCDVIPPGTINDLAPDVVGPNEIWFTWTATADDGVIPESGPERSFDLRGLTAPLDASNWGNGIQSTDESVPGGIGTWGSGHVGGLQPCTSYYFCVRARDDHSQDGGYFSTSFQTSCGGGGGGNSAQQVWSGEEGAAAATAQGVAPNTGLLVVATRPDAGGMWHVSMSLQPTPVGSEPPTATITVEPVGESGSSDTLSHFKPQATDNLLGLCALRDRGRLGIPGVYSIQVMPHLRARAGDLALRAGTHSRLGALSEAFVASGGPVEIAIGDSLNLTYSPAAAPLSDAESWYALVRRTGDAPPTPMNAHRGPSGETRPARFALYQNHPNPFRGTTVIPFDLASEAQVSLSVFDVLGRRVATLVDGTLPAGSHTGEWDMRSQAGGRVAPGIYTYRITAGAFHERRKMTVLP